VTFSLSDSVISLDPRLGVVGSLHPSGVYAGQPPEHKAEQLGTPRLTLATGRFRVANHLYLCDTRLEAIGAVPVPTTIAWWSASHRIMVTRSLVLCMGTGVGHIGCHTM
jgi:hypothetical protein